MNKTLVITLMSDDRPGIIQQLSNIVNHNSATWGHSHFANLAGKFSGIAEIMVAEDKRNSLIQGLEALNHDGMSIAVETVHEKTSPANTHKFSITANDRTGIIMELSTHLAAAGYSIESIQSKTESGSMAGIPLFKAQLEVISAGENSISQLQNILEAVSDDIFVDFN